MTACPNSTAAGCRCPEHHPGLVTFSPAPEQLIPRLTAIGQPLRVVSTPPREICHGYAQGCICTTCVDRDANGGPLAAPVQPADQPWVPRRPRHQRAA